MLNKIFIMGRLTRDPELRYTQAGVPVARFTLAVDRDYRDDEGERETDFIDCVAWRNMGEFIQRHFHKGSMAIVVGRLQLRKWTDDEGNKRVNSDIKVESIYFGESKKQEKAPDRAPETAPAPSNYSNYAPADYSYTPTFMDLDYEDIEQPF